MKRDISQHIFMCHILYTKELCLATLICKDFAGLFPWWDHSMYVICVNSMCYFTFNIQRFITRIDRSLVKFTSVYKSFFFPTSCIMHWSWQPSLVSLFKLCSMILIECLICFQIWDTDYIKRIVSQQNATILYYSVLENQLLLWVLRPVEGIARFYCTRTSEEQTFPQQVSSCCWKMKMEYICFNILFVSVLHHYHHHHQQIMCSCISIYMILHGNESTAIGFPLLFYKICK